MKSNKTLKERVAALWEPGTDSHLKALDAILFGVVSIAAVGAFVFQSVERFADREHLFLGGMFTIFALLAVMSFRIGRGPVIQLWGSMFMLAFAAFLLFLTGTDAVRRSDWNDRRCLRIQEAMLHPGPKTRTDLADVFTALQCRPQGFGPSVTKRTDGSGKTEALRQAENERARQRAVEQEVAIDMSEANPAPTATEGVRKPPSGKLFEQLHPTPTAEYCPVTMGCRAIDSTFQAAETATRTTGTSCSAGYPSQRGARRLNWERWAFGTITIDQN